MNKRRLYKNEILECAMQIVESEGLKSLKLQRILDKCGIGKATFYRFFASKEDLISQLKDFNADDNLEIANAKELIIVKAKEAFSLYGFNRIDMDSIAKSAGVNRVTLYRYFSSKDELLESCIKYEFTGIKEALGRYFSGENDPEEALKRYMENYCRFISNSFDNVLISETWNQVYQNEKIKEHAKDLIDYFVDGFSKTIEAGKEKGIFKSDVDSYALAHVMVMMQNGMGFSAKIDQTVDITCRIKDMILRLLFDTIYK